MPSVFSSGASQVFGSNPSIVFWENVPGVLNTKDNAFGCFLGALAGENDALVPPGGRWSNAGFIDGPQRAVAWRVLDAQYFGVAQRRRRVFVIASARNDFDPAAVLFEFEGLRRNTAPSREKRESVTASTRTGASVGSLCARTGQSISVQDAAQGHLLPTWAAEISSTLDTTFGTKMGLENQHVNAGCPMFVPAQPIALAENTIGRQPENGGNGDGFTDGGPMYTLNATGVHGVAQPIGVDTYNGAVTGQVSCTITADVGGPTHSGPKIMQSMAVRRLTPVECERLQGFPDNYTKIADKTPDGPRYKALGNSWAVPVVRWIGERIARAT